MKQQATWYSDYFPDEPYNVGRVRDYAKEAEYKRHRMQRCPICGVYENIITNVHCQLHHSMTKKEVEAIHGKITTGGRWNANATTTIKI